MNVECVNSDKFSSLPQNIIENILTLIPIREAVRTSILSRKWRFCWTGMPKLVFDHTLVEEPSMCSQMRKYRHAIAIFYILLQHTGLILEVNLYVSLVDIDPDFDLIIRHLSRSNTVKKLILKFSGCSYSHYKLPSSFFSLQGLEYLELENCDFGLLSILNGFSRLKSLCCSDINNFGDGFQRFLSDCPLLTDVTLMGSTLQRYEDFTFVDLLQCVPLIRTLHIVKGIWMEYLSAGGMPLKFPTTAVHLKYLYLDVYFNVQDEISSTFHLIRNSPNLEKLVISIFEQDDASPISMNFLDLHDYCGFNLDHLEYFEMEWFQNSSSEMELVKLIMAKLPVLKEVRLKLSYRVSIDEDQLKIRRLPCASSSAMLIIERGRW